VQPDPRKGGPNTFMYALDEPTSFYDMYGLDPYIQTGVGAGGRVGFLGGSVAANAALDSHGNICLYLQVCVRIGLGVYGGFGWASGWGTEGGATGQEGAGIDVGADAGVGAVSAGATGTPGRGTQGTHKPSDPLFTNVNFSHLGPGIGLDVGLDFCYTKKLKCVNTRCWKLDPPSGPIPNYARGL